MIKINLSDGNDSLSLDKLAFGTGSFSDYNEESSYFLLMDKFFQHFKTFDTARSYNEWLPDGKDISGRQAPGSLPRRRRKSSFPHRR